MSVIGMPRAQLLELAGGAHRHLQPIIEAAANHAVAIGTVLQNAGRFDRPPGGRSFCFIVGDDVLTSKGPSAFHQKSLRRLLGQATHVAINAADLEPSIYNAAADTAALGGNVVIVECRPETETEWMNFIMRYAPQADTFIRTPNTGAYACSAGKA